MRISDWSSDVCSSDLLTNVVPGHGRRSLFMQNSLRDALLASLNFNIFIRHADRVRMTAIAQMVNVAQSMILPEGKQMVLTPPYHAFELYTPVQDETALPLDIRTHTIGRASCKQRECQYVSISVRAGSIKKNTHNSHIP